jgi:GntR family transcriptional regulator
VEIERDSDVPVYVQLASILREMITSGQIPPRRAIPSKNTIMQTYGVALGTTNKALDLLRSEGLIRSVQGLGVFVTDPASRDGS